MLEYLRNLSAGREEPVNYFCRQFAVTEELGELLFQRDSFLCVVLRFCRIDLFAEFLYLLLFLLYLL